MMSSQAYAYEPKYSDTELSRIEEDSSVDRVDQYETERVSDEHRLDSSHWCLCSACEVMPTVIECQCCREFSKIKDKMELIGLDPDVQECITSSDRFDVVCLDKDILHITLLMIHDSLVKGPLPNPVPNS